MARRYKGARSRPGTALNAFNEAEVRDSPETRLGRHISPMANGCWLYNLDGDTHHSARRADGSMTKAYRLVWEILVGPVPEGHHLHHKCLTPGCVNPDHLEPLTPSEHGREHAAAKRRK